MHSANIAALFRIHRFKLLHPLLALFKLRIFNVSLVHANNFASEVPRRLISLFHKYLEKFLSFTPD